MAANRLNRTRPRYKSVRSISVVGEMRVSVGILFSRTWKCSSLKLTVISVKVRWNSCHPRSCRWILESPIYIAITARVRTRVSYSVGMYLIEFSSELRNFWLLILRLGLSFEDTRLFRHLIRARCAVSSSTAGETFPGKLDTEISQPREFREPCPLV